MNNEVESKIRAYCKKCHMDCDNLEITPIDNNYMARDEKVRVLFDKDGNVNSPTMNYAYGQKTTKFIGKSTCILVFASFIAALLFLFIWGFLQKI